MFLSNMHKMVPTLTIAEHKILHNKPSILFAKSHSSPPNSEIYSPDKSSDPERLNSFDSERSKSTMNSRVSDNRSNNLATSESELSTPSDPWSGKRLNDGNKNKKGVSNNTINRSTINTSDDEDDGSSLRIVPG